MIFVSQIFPLKTQGKEDDWEFSTVAFVETSSLLYLPLSILEKFLFWKKSKDELPDLRLVQMICRMKIDWNDLNGQQWRTLLSLTDCYKTINGLNCLNPHEFFNFADKYRPLRSNHRFKLKMKSAKLNCYKHSFFLRIVNLWNNLRKETAEAKDLRTFRNKLVNEFS